MIFLTVAMVTRSHGSVLFYIGRAFKPLTCTNARPVIFK